MTFHSVGNVIIPTDELIFFRGVGIPPTSKSRHLNPAELLLRFHRKPNRLNPLNLCGADSWMHVFPASNAGV